MATDSLGEYKVVVTADYSQLQAQFQAMANVITQTTSSISSSLDKTFSVMNDRMSSHLKGMTDSMQNAFNGVKTSVNGATEATNGISEPLQRASSSARRGAEGFKDYAARVREAEKAEQQFRAMSGKSILAAEEREIAGRTARHKAFWEEEVKNERMAERESQRAARERERRINNLQTQYRVAYAEINKYLQSHAKMSEAVFIRLQSKLSAISSQLHELKEVPPMANPLAGMNYEKYESGFSRLTDAVKALKHHMAWMASAAVMAGFIGLPTAISKATEAFDALNTKIMQNMELSSEYEGNTQKLHSDMGRMAKDAMVLSQGYGISVNEVQEAMQTLSRRFKDAGTAVYLTDIALKMSKLDMVDTKQSAKDLEAVMLQFGMGAKQAKDFLNDFSVICHTARISGTDMLMALERSGSAFKAMNMGAREAMAAIAAVSTVTGKTGATIGDSWKSILANMDFKKATAALEHYNIKLYETASNGARVMRSGSTVLSEILTVYKDLDDKQRRQLATAIAGGRRKLAA